MSTRRFRLGVILSAFLCCGCAPSNDPNIYAKWEGGEARVVVRSIRDAAQLGIAGVVVYGDVLIKSESHLRRADLGCLFLLGAEQRSSKPYVNSVAHIMTNRYPADADGAVRARLYWIFQGRDVNEFKPNRLTLVVDQSRGPCLIWGAGVMGSRDRERRGSEFKVSCAEREPPSWEPTRQLIKSVESSLILPQGMYPLSSYIRYYAGEVADQKRLVRGVFLYQKTFGKVEIVESGRLPHILDGGCGVVDLIYSVDERRVISISCQGVG